MLSLTELRRATPLLSALIEGHQVQRIVAPDPMSVVLTTYGAGGGPEAGSKRRHLRFSCRPGSARVSQLGAPAKSGSGQAPPNTFTQYLRAHVDGARVGGIRLRNDDRQLAVQLVTTDAEFELLLSILGPRSNLYLLDAAGKLLASLRPLAETRPELKLGGDWASPESRPPSAGTDRFENETDDRLLVAFEREYALVEKTDEVASLRRRIAKALKKETKGLDRKLEKLESSLAEAREASRLARDGELLKTALPQIKRGDTQVTVSDFETGEPVSIELDPKLGPAENLNRLFKRYHKAVRSATKAGARQQEVASARAEIEQWSERFRALVQDREGQDRQARAGDDAGEVDGDGPSIGELEAFADEAPIRKLVAKYAPATPAERRAPGRPIEHKLGKLIVPGRLMPRRYRTAGGLEIWVGRSAAGNDHLSVRLARGKDLFFHLDGAPGSHVILRTEGKSDPPGEAVLDACELAVHFSTQKNASRADVHAVPIANVRKPKGAKPGLVTVHGGKTIHLRRIPQRLQKILESLIDPTDS
ncbi:MAG: NFACT RNA binding domain-containing protein [Myxococcota bacterium]